MLQEGDLSVGGWIYGVRSNKHLARESHEEGDFEKIYLQTLFGLSLSLGKRLCRRLRLFYTHVRDNEGMGGRRGEEGTITNMKPRVFADWGAGQ